MLGVEKIEGLVILVIRPAPDTVALKVTHKTLAVLTGVCELGIALLVGNMID